MLNKTQDECQDYCVSITVATGCQYTPKEARCLAFTYTIYMEKKKGSLDRCLIFEQRNKDARKRKEKKHLNTPNGRLAIPYKLIPTTFIYLILWERVQRSFVSFLLSN